MALPPHHILVIEPHPILRERIVAVLVHALVGAIISGVASIFLVLAHGRTLAGMELQFSSVPTRHHELQCPTDLGTWLIVPGQEDITPTGAATTVTDPNPPPGTAAHRIVAKPGSF